MATSQSEDAMEEAVARAAALPEQADGLVITAGAGIGVDSGLPDFRGDHGFWNAYPALGGANIRFEEIASPSSFDCHPRLAWGFYGHRLNLYRKTVPNEGFSILKAMAKRLVHGCFIYTSNCDGQFQKAGFSDHQIVECHGSIHYQQCLNGCTSEIWSAEDFLPVVDEENCLLVSDLPTCPHCGELARSNVLLFNDWTWVYYRQHEQRRRLDEWLRRLRRPIVIEIGAGTAIPSVRRFGESLGCPLIRINPTEHRVDRPQDVGLPVKGVDALRSLSQALGLG